MASNWQVHRSEAFFKAQDAELFKRAQEIADPGKHGRSGSEAFNRWHDINSFITLLNAMDAPDGRPHRLLLQGRSSDYNLPVGKRGLSLYGFLAVYDLDTDNKIGVGEHFFVAGSESLADYLKPKVATIIQASNAAADKKRSDEKAKT
jgi:hypothetical protein